MTTKYVTIPYDALRMASEIPLCGDDSDCSKYAGYRSILRRKLGERFGYFCDTHTKPGDERCNWSGHADALNEAIAKVP